MESKVKLIAFYLPQFHEIPENNEMWGKGFTEWVNVKKAKPLFDGHFQPVEPLDDKYYNLENVDIMRWQVQLAKKYGLYGFCFYHYWYNGHKLLHKPIENYLDEKEIDFPFCLCWANHDWTMAWANKSDNVLYRHDYTKKEDWTTHFEYLLNYFQDNRYIIIDGKPLMVIYQGARLDQQKYFVEMMDCWNDLAKKMGFEGIHYAYQSVDIDLSPGKDSYNYSYDIEYQPLYAHRLIYKNKESQLINFLQKINSKTFKIPFSTISKLIHRNNVEILDYDDCWNKILNMQPIRKNSIPCAFVGCDTTPRKGKRGMVIKGMTPEKFQRYLAAQIKRTKEIYQKDMLFIFAWNEWAEGAYMEPDKRWKYGVLEAMSNAIENANTESE